MEAIADFNMKNELTENYSVDLSKCKSLTLISSESCNLNCSYCVIAKSINKEQKIAENEKIKASFNDGTYLNNIKKISKKYNLNPYELKHLELWGQEPTLTLNEFKNAFKGFYDFFPNLDSFYFSTNGVAFPNRIVDLAKHMDEIVDKPFDFGFQISYDGYEATKNLRGIKPEIIIQNVETIILALNKIEFKNLKINVSFHNVLSAAIINKYGGSDEYNDEFYKYLDELSSLGMHFHLMNTNANVVVHNLFTPGIEVPYNATAQEGKNLCNFIEKATQIGKNLDVQWWIHILYKFNEYLEYTDKQNNLDVFPVITSYLPTENEYDNYVKSLSTAMGCGSNYDDVKIRYDGTILHCQNGISFLQMADYADKEELTYNIHKEIVPRKYYPNLLKDEDELEVYKSLQRGHLFRTSSFPFIVSEVLNLMIILLKCNQIDESYNDYTKLFSHALKLSQIFICWDNNLNTTGSGFGKLAGEIRFYCNGFLDIVVQAEKDSQLIREDKNGC